MSNLEAARTDSRRDALVALRDSLAGAMDEVAPTVYAQLAAQYRATLLELEALTERVEVVSKHDELRKRREARRADADKVAVAGKKVRKRGA